MIKTTFRDSESGQALLETALFMPFFLLCLFALIWASQTASLSERVQLGVRYGGLITQSQQPYTAYSLYSIYATIDGSPPLSSSNCALPDSSSVLGNRHSFFQALSISTQSCVGGRSVLSSGFDNTVILQNSYLDLSAQGYAPNFLISHGLPNIKNTTVATQNFFRSPDLETLTCITDVGPYLKNSLEGFYDRSSVVNVTPSPYGHYPDTAATISANTASACTTFSPQPTPPPIDAAVPSAPVYTIPPNLPTAPPPTPCGCTAGPVPTGNASPGNVSLMPSRSNKRVQRSLAVAAVVDNRLRVSTYALRSKTNIFGRLAYIL